MDGRTESMFSETLQILEHYRDSGVYDFDNNSFYTRDTYVDDRSPRTHLAAPRLRNKLPPSGQRFVLTPESLSPTSDRSSSPPSPASSHTTLSGSSRQNSKGEIRMRRTPQGSQIKVTDLQLKKSNGSTDLGHVDLPRMKQLGLHTPPRSMSPNDFDEPPPPPPPKSELRKSLRRTAVQDQPMKRSDANITGIWSENNPYTEQSSYTNKRVAQGLKVTVPEGRRNQPEEVRLNDIAREIENQLESPQLQRPPYGNIRKPSYNIGNPYGPSMSEMVGGLRSPSVYANSPPPSDQDEPPLPSEAPLPPLKVHNNNRPHFGESPMKPKHKPSYSTSSVTPQSTTIGASLNAPFSQPEWLDGGYQGPSLGGYVVSPASSSASMKRRVVQSMTPLSSVPRDHLAISPNNLAISPNTLAVSPNTLPAPSPAPKKPLPKNPYEMRKESEDWTRKDSDASQNSSIFSNENPFERKPSDSEPQRVAMRQQAEELRAKIPEREPRQLSPPPPTPPPKIGLPSNPRAGMAKKLQKPNPNKPSNLKIGPPTPMKDLPPGPPFAGRSKTPGPPMSAALSSAGFNRPKTPGGPPPKRPPRPEEELPQWILNNTSDNGRKMVATDSVAIFSPEAQDQGFHSRALSKSPPPSQTLHSQNGPYGNHARGPSVISPLSSTSRGRKPSISSSQPSPVPFSSISGTLANANRLNPGDFIEDTKPWMNNNRAASQLSSNSAEIRIGFSSDFGANGPPSSNYGVTPGFPPSAGFGPGPVVGNHSAKNSQTGYVDQQQQGGNNPYASHSANNSQSYNDPQRDWFPPRGRTPGGSMNDNNAGPAHRRQQPSYDRGRMRGPSPGPGRYGAGPRNNPYEDQSYGNNGAPRGRPSYDRGPMRGPSPGPNRRGPSPAGGAFDRPNPRFAGPPSRDTSPFRGAPRNNMRQGYDGDIDINAAGDGMASNGMPGRRPGPSQGPGPRGALLSPGGSTRGARLGMQMEMGTGAPAGLRFNKGGPAAPPHNRGFSDSSTSGYGAGPGPRGNGRGGRALAPPHGGPGRSMSQDRDPEVSQASLYPDMDREGPYAAMGPRRGPSPPNGIGGLPGGRMPGLPVGGPAGRMRMAAA